MFRVGDTVDIKGRTDLDYYGKILEIKKDKAIVHLKFVRHPEGRERGVCEACGFPGFFSVNGGTGEIVCMKSGCGYGYGFIERDELVSIDKLINITEKKKQKEKQKRIAAIQARVRIAKREIERAFADGIITENEKSDFLKTLK